MGGFDLQSGEYKSINVTEEELWDSFRNVFSSKTTNSSSYKFVFLKSLLDCIEKYDKHRFSLYELFERFTEIYWILVIKYGLTQSNSCKKNTYVEQILLEYIGCTSDEHFFATIKYDDLTDSAREKIVHQVESKCKKYVIGALYEDTKELFYSFSKKESFVDVNPVMYKFLQKHGNAISELNYYELTKFIDKVNSRVRAERIAENRNYDFSDTIDVYRQVIFDEFEATKDQTQKNDAINTIEILMTSEEKLDSSAAFERENMYLKKLYMKEIQIEEDTESMKAFLDDPETVVKMILARKKIIC